MENISNYNHTTKKRAYIESFGFIPFDKNILNQN